LLRSNTEEERKILHTALEREYCIEEAGSTGEALQIMYRKAVAVFLCDADMPGFAEVLEQMYRDKELPLIPVFATKPSKMRVLRVQIQNALEYRWIFFIIWCILLVGVGWYICRAGRLKKVRNRTGISMERRPMKKHIILGLLIAGLLTLTACVENSPYTEGPDSIPKDSMAEPEFPLDKGTIMKTVDSLNLPCVISEDESEELLTRENTVYSNYVLRDPERKYHEDSLDTILYGGIISGIVDGNRYMSTIFDAKSHMVNDKPFAWEDWKQEIIFITILYGGFEDEEEVYRALSKLEVPDDDKVLKWGVQLSNGYCGVQRSSNIQPADSRGYTIWINFYETEELYLKMEQEKKEAQEKVREEYKKRQEALKKQQKETAPADASKRTGA
jgi:hypothetical protein